MCSIINIVWITSYATNQPSFVQSFGSVFTKHLIGAIYLCTGSAVSTVVASDQLRVADNDSKSHKVN